LTWKNCPGGRLHERYSFSTTANAAYMYSLYAELHLLPLWILREGEEKVNEKRFSGFILGIFNARNIVFVAMLAVGALCIFMSARNTASYLLLTGMEQVMSILTGMALIVFSATSFTAAQLFLAQKGAAKLFSIFFVVIGITVITFSIFSTLSLNYDKFLKSDVIQADIQDMIEKNRSALLRDKTEESHDVTQWTMDNMDRLLAMAEQQGASWNNSMRTIMETAQNLSATEKETVQNIVENIYVDTIPRTFFAFILRLKEIDRKYFFDFFMIAIPAVFYDLLAPLAITVVLFLMGFKSKKEEAEAEAIAEVPASATPPKPKEEAPSIKDLTTYIENAMQEEYQILPDDAVPNIDAQKCAKCRNYLASFIYKGNPLITESGDQYVSIFDKVNLIRFITLQGNVQRQGEQE